MTSKTNSRTPSRRQRATALWCAALVAAMVGAAYASVPFTGCSAR